jgi:hypothetical protein
MFCTTLWVLCPLLVWTGLMGGAAYVNVMHNLLESEDLKEKEKEAAITMSLICNDSGVFISTIFTLIADNTIFKEA